MTDEQVKKDDEFKKVVIAKLELLPANLRIHIGSTGTFSKDELIENVKKGTPVGDKMIEIELNYLRNLQEGIFYGQDSLDNEA